MYMYSILLKPVVLQIKVDISLMVAGWQTGIHVLYNVGIQ